MLRHLAILTAFIFFALCINAQLVSAQQEDSLLAQQLPANYLDKVSSKASQLEQKLDRKSEKALQQMMKLEERIKRKVSSVDSGKSKEIFADAEQKYKDLEQRLQGALSEPYIANLDSVVTSLKFLQQNPQLLSRTKEAQQKLKEALGKVNGLETRFQKAEEIKNFLRTRKEFLKEKLQDLSFGKELKAINKKFFYYQAQVAEYKETLKDHKRAEKKAIELLSRNKLFQDFFRKNSMLASLFRMPGDPNDPTAQVSLAGLQTRTQVNSLIQQTIAAGGPSAQAQFQQNLQEAQNKINELKNKINQLGGGSSGMEMPEGFQKNTQRTNSFWKKWELGVNIQSNKANGFMPVSSDLGISAGFKPNDKFIAGVGFAGRIGWGKDIRHIAISYSGVSARSFAELKLKGSFNAVVGFEMNYRNEIRQFTQLQNYPAWQKSGLAGISKIISVKSKFFKKTKLQLLWDFLNYQQIPRGQPVIFRIGYQIK